MAEQRYVSTTQVASALGVSVTTVKRWVDEGILPAHKTPGGHRKLLLTDVLRISREGSFPHLDLRPLRLLSDGGVGADMRALSARLLGGLRQGDASAARVLLREAYQSGVSPAVLADAVVGPAMAQIGQDWERGRIDVLHEHRGTLACVAALLGVKALLEEDADGGRPLAVGGGPEGDPYLLANVLAELVLLDAGWQVINLGPNTPLASFRKAIAEYRPRLLWLSVNYLLDTEAFVSQYHELHQCAAKAGVAVALGGRGLTDELRARLPYTTFGDGMGQLAAFARSIHPLPRRPRRGRPRAV